MTSNTREDNPVWNQIAGFNRAQARLSYVATLGQPRTQVAWLLADAHWKDAPAFSFFGPDPNKRESETSKTLTAAGLQYDRISRRDLIGATAQGRELVVGHARYEALLITNVEAADPALLQNVITLARQGVEILWAGEFPARAQGWADHERRDQTVRRQGLVLQELVSRPPANDRLAAGIRAMRVRAVLAPADGNDMRLRMHGRLLGDDQFILLFNESDDAITDRYVTRDRVQSADLLNPESGAITSLAIEPGTTTEMEIAVPARRIRILHLKVDVADPVTGSSPPVVDWNQDTWREPPRRMYPFVRWWWPGNAVTGEELRRELRSLHDAGYGGVEVQTLTLGFTMDALQANRDSIYQVGTPAYFENLRAVFEEAQRLGMTVDLTMGSGWSSGGPFIERHPEQQLIKSSLDAAGPGRIDVELPAPQQPAYVTRTNKVIRNTIGTFDGQARLKLVVAARVDDSTAPATLSDLTDISSHVADGRIRWEVPAGNFRIFAIYQNATSHNTAGSAYPGALERSPVLDHLGRGGADEYIQKLGEPWLAALKPFKPAAFFVDSFELIAELPWSSGFPAAFRQMHGYDLLPYLPLVFRNHGESKYTEAFAPTEPAYQSTDDRAQRIREDYEATRESLFVDQFLLPLKKWTEANGIQLRLQAHGGYGDYLESYQIADIPEAEGLFGGGSFDFLKLASSAAHVAGRPIVASESFINLTLDFDALEIDDYYLLAGNAYAAGINRTVCHGYAYHHPLHP